VRPVLTYASQTWVLSKADERSLGLFERRVLRCIFGAVQDKDIQRKRYNHELYNIFNKPDITEYIKINGLSWGGHIIHMENSRTVKVFDTRPEGTRKIRRAKLRWEDGTITIQDIRALGMKKWRTSVMNREDAVASEEGRSPYRTVGPMMIIYCCIWIYI
jgi:hypothetical protein